MSHKGEHLNTKRSLEAFANRLERKMRQVKGRDAAERLFLRLVYSEDERIAALMFCKWVEWKYGKAKEFVEHSGTIDHTMTIEEIKARARKMLEVDRKTLSVEPAEPTENGHNAS